MIQETLEYMNTLVLGESNYKVQSFDLYEFLMHSDVTIKSIEILGKLFKVEKMDSIKKSNVCFGNALYYNDSNDVYVKIKTKGNDGQFWEYLRSLSAIHPLETTKSNFIDNNEENFLHTSPYAMWTQYCPIFLFKKTGDVYVKIWKGSSNSLGAALFFDISMIVAYIKIML